MSRRTVVLLVAALVGILLITGAYAVSNVIERKYNLVRVRPPYQVSTATADLQKKLFVADLHSDSLL